MTKPEQLEWPETREDAKALPELKRTKIAAAMFWAMLGAPVPSAPDYRWNDYCRGLRLIGLPDWAVDDIAADHREWKDRRNERRRKRRLERKGETNG